MHIKLLKFDKSVKISLMWTTLIIIVIHIEMLCCQQVEIAWTDKLGDELWHLSKLVTKHDEIKQKYKTLNARVETNDGRSLLNQIVSNIDKMLQKKIKAVQCIVSEAEELAEAVTFEENFMLEYYNLKYSPNAFDSNKPDITKVTDNNFTIYKNMTLAKNGNFYNIPVNTEYSAVHIPTNLYDRYPEVAEAIQWSEGLDKIFYDNYRADPGLSWQYFGATTGMMRQYPAMTWMYDEDETDLYDCRRRPWFVEAATCTKDVVILMDSSGSMTGMRSQIAKLVVNHILETFDNNDFINVMYFNWTAESILSCYKDQLAQGTPENIKLFQKAVQEIKPEGNASFPNAFETAFKLLAKYREERGCDNGTDCNQAIMLVTDGLPGNITQVFEDYNRGENGSIPVRVFTYLIGLEVRGVQEIQLMACENRGYYVHIHNLDEVRDQVLKYISVIARPLVLQKEEHPISWSHLFADVSDLKLSTWLTDVMKNDDQKNRESRMKNIKPEYYSRQREDSKYVQDVTQIQGEEKEIEHKEYRMMTSVSMPVFDKRERNDTVPANLLGVAGTDILIDDIYSLTYPYKIGANGYAFIVTNNGYFLMHPDLRPVFQGILKENYNSVDFVEVEFADDNSTYLEYNENILRLRESLVYNIEDKLDDVEIKFHYDDMRRVGTEKRDFYISPLPYTPFSIGLTIPSDYGDYQISVGDEVHKSFQQGKSLVEFFKDKDNDGTEKDWRIHPDWTYCKYRYADYKKFDTPEDELLHFLEKMRQVGWKWNPRYSNDTEVFDSEDGCNRPHMPESSYYCDKDLIQLLIFDARVTEPFKHPKIAKNDFEEKKLKTYNTTLRFVSTQSGFTRWQSIPKPTKGSSNSDFGNAFPRAINEPWFIAAVLQYQLDSDSFVFTVPLAEGESDDVYITATHAIFPVDGTRKAPAAVVGYQMTQKSFYDRFTEITSKVHGLAKTCDSEERICYVLDHNGYVIISTSGAANETGKFFGIMESSAMSKLVEIEMFRKIRMYDYQALCVEDIPDPKNAASILLTPFVVVKRFVEFLFSDVIWSLLQLTMQQLYNVDFVKPQPDSDEDLDYSAESIIKIPVPKKELRKKEDNCGNVTINIIQDSWPCDKVRDFYLFNNESEYRQKHYSNSDAKDGRLHFARRIPHTNMVLVVINTLYTLEEGTVHSVDWKNISNTGCHRADLNALPKQRLSNCFSQHPLESELDACGIGNEIRISLFLVVISIALAFTFG